MRRAGFWLWEFVASVALLVAILFLFLLVMGTALIPTEGLGVGRHYDDFCTPPGSIPWWLLGLAIAIALLTGAVLLIGFALWARRRERASGALSPSVVPILQAVFCMGVAVITSWTLWVNIDEWGWYTDHCSRVEPAFNPPVSASTHLAQGLLAVLIVGTIAGMVFPMRRMYARTHPDQPLSATTMARIAGALVMTAVFGVAYFGSFALLGRLGHDTRRVPCLEPDLWHCYEYSPPSDGRAWLLVGIAQVAALAGMLVFFALARAPFRGRDPRTRLISRLGPRVVRIAWMIGVAVTVIVDLVVYIGQRIDWGNL